jgi:hypothetical protein
MLVRSTLRRSRTFWTSRSCWYRLSWRAAAERLDTICDRHRACGGRGALAELLHSAPLPLGWRRVTGRLSATRKRAAERRPGSRSEIDVAQRLTVCVAHDETVRRYFGSPRRREAARLHQAADWISPVNATRTASSRSASVKPRCSCRRAKTRSRKTPRALDRHAVGGGPDRPKLRIGKGEHGGHWSWRCRRCQTVSNFQREPACQCIRFAACGARACALIRPAVPERPGTQQNASTAFLFTSGLYCNTLRHNSICYQRGEYYVGPEAAMAHQHASEGFSGRARH